MLCAECAQRAGRFFVLRNDDTLIFCTTSLHEGSFFKSHKKGATPLRKLIKSYFNIPYTFQR
jgi:hypothetical protein